MDVGDHTLKAFVEALASDAPAPGAGAAGGASLAFAAACAAKAFRISARHLTDPALSEAAERALALAARALEGAERDARDFRVLLKSGSKDAAAALRRDGDALLSLQAELRALVAEHAAQVVPALQGDLLAADALARAFDAIEWRNLSELEGP